MRILVVCTANVCRSPVAAALLGRRLAEVGVRAVATSAGTNAGWGMVDRVHRYTLKAVEPYGVDLSSHRARPLDVEVLRRDGADLVITMTREHLYNVVGSDPSSFGRTFTLPELARRAADVSACSPFSEWLGALGEGRTTSDLLPGSDDDDVADPYGLSQRAHVAMVAAVDQMTRTVAESLSGIAVPGPGGFR